VPDDDRCFQCVAAHGAILRQRGGTVHRNSDYVSVRRGSNKRARSEESELG
jgi:hypothetical protein